LLKFEEFIIFSNSISDQVSLGLLRDSATYEVWLQSSHFHKNKFKSKLSNMCQQHRIQTCFWLLWIIYGEPDLWRKKVILVRISHFP